MVKVVTLNNGIRMVLEHITHIQSAALGIWVNVGSIDESKEHAGISHFIEHMMFKGTENRTAKEIASDVDKMGGQINAFTGKEATCYYIKTISSNILKGADVLVDMLTNSKFEDSEMDKERKVIFEEIKMTNDTPDELCIDELVELVFKNIPLGNSIIGTQDSLNRIDSKVLREYYENQYALDHMVISLSGNYNEKEIIDYFNDKFDKFVKTKDEPVVFNDQYLPRTKVILKDIEQSHICLGNRGLKLQDENYYDLIVLNKIFGGSMSSRLFQNIRESKGLAYTIMSLYGCQSNNGYFAIYAGVAHDKIKDTLDGIKDELDGLLKNGITIEELNMAKEQIKASYIFGQESVASRMFNNGKNILLCNNVFSQEEVIKKVDKVSVESVQRLINKICHFDDYCAAVVTNGNIDLDEMMGRNNENKNC